MRDKLFKYIRNSTDIQVAKNTEENQEKVIERFLKDKNVEIIDSFEDLGMSGSLVERPGYQAMLKRLHEVDGIVIYDIDRLSRDYKESMNLMFILNENHKKLYIARTGEINDFSKDENLLTYSVIAWVAQNERKKIKERQKEGIKRYKDKKGRWGRKKKEVDWKKYEFYHDKLKLPITSTSKILGMHYNTLRERIKEREEGK